jgi:SAM-dependent methyltransferase
MGINKVEPYEALAAVYQAAGFTTYATSIAQTLLSIAFDLSWTGKTLIDLGCGTGDLGVWFGGRQIRSVGIDNSATMLQQADAGAISAGVDATFAEGDIRSYVPSTTHDLAMCVGGTINTMTSLRDVEAVFRVAHASLAPRKLFFFDLRTIQSLAKADGMRILADNDAFMVVAKNTFNYESLALTTQYSIFRDGEAGWTRSEETHILRGYPAQTISKILQNVGFRLVQMITPSAVPLDAQTPDDVVLFVAAKN